MSLSSGDWEYAVQPNKESEFITSSYVGGGSLYRRVDCGLVGEGDCGRNCEGESVIEERGDIGEGAEGTWRRWFMRAKTGLGLMSVGSPRHRSSNKLFTSKCPLQAAISEGIVSFCKGIRPNGIFPRDLMDICYEQ